MAVMAEETSNLFNGVVREGGTPRRTADRFADRFAGLPMAQAALEFASVRHSGQYRDIDGAPFIAHPIEVGELLQADGQPDEVVAAGLLHDVLEKTTTTSVELRRRFGPGVAWLVETVSDDASILAYEQRKRALRDRVARAAPDTVEIFAADKIAKVRELARLPPPRLDESDARAKLAHYRACLRMLRRVAGRAPLVQRLDVELDRLFAPTVTKTRFSSGRSRCG